MDTQQTNQTIKQESKLAQKHEESVGDALKAARIARGWEIDDVAERLKIGGRRVTVIETGTYEGGQMSVYYRGYFRSYCRLLNLESDTLLAQLESEGVHVREDQHLEAHHEAGWTALKQHDHSKAFYVLYALLGIVVLLLVVWAYRAHTSPAKLEHQLQAIHPKPQTPKKAKPEHALVKPKSANQLDSEASVSEQAVQDTHSAHQTSQILPSIESIERLIEPEPNDQHSEDRQSSDEERHA